jgi:hypothetical protein
LSQFHKNRSLLSSHPELLFPHQPDPSLKELDTPPLASGWVQKQNNQWGAQEIGGKNPPEALLGSDVKVQSPFSSSPSPLEEKAMFSNQMNMRSVHHVPETRINTQFWR